MTVRKRGKRHDFKYMLLGNFARAGRLMFTLLMIVQGAELLEKQVFAQIT